MSLGILLAFASMITWGVGDFFIQRATRRLGNYVMIATIGLLGTIIFMPSIIAEFSVLADWHNLLFLIILGATSIIHSLLILQAFNVGKLSVVEVVAQIELPVTIILSMIILKEYLSTSQTIIITLLLFGVILTAFESFNDWKNVERGVWIAALAGFFMGLDNFFTGFASRTITPMMAIAVPWVVFMIVAMIVLYYKEIRQKNIKGIKNIKFIEENKSPVNQNLKKIYERFIGYRWIIFIGASFNIAGWIFFTYAVKNSPIAIIAAIAEGYIVVALLLGIIINKEQIRTHQYIGAGLAIICAILLSMTV